MARSSKRKEEQRRSLITLKQPKSPVSEQYRTVRTNIEFSTIDKDIKTLLVTSAGPAEGKSTTTNNLAVVFAQQGKKVLLIDGDLRKPTAHYSFQIENYVGLTNVLTKQSTLEKAIHVTEQENLYVLTSGPIPPNPAEILGSHAMDDLLAQVTKEFDLVVFDSPPVLAVTDAQVLANKSDGVVLVVNSGKTNNDAALKAKEFLVNAKAKLLGVILNNRKQKDSQYYYYYGN